MQRESRQLIFIWHLHQPYYGLPDRPYFMLPWVRLHATKSYYDMARILERHPTVKGTMNFSGALLKQLREYVEDGKRDTWWQLTQRDAASLDAQERLFLLRNFFSINWSRCIDIYPRYGELLDKRGRGGELADPSTFSVEDIRDLQVWFNLAWFGFAAREERPIVRELIRKGRGFSEAEKEAVLEQQLDVMALIEPIYRDLNARGQIEISVTPMYHPILPLLIDTEEAAIPSPDRARPRPFRAPGDAAKQIEDARSIAREFLGIDVDGMWPAEGSVSPRAYELFAAEGVSWIATDEEVLRHSRGPDWHRKKDLYRPWRLGDGPAIFFRDHAISDQVGFVYANNDPNVAAADLIGRVESAPAGSVVSVILDGENPWEHYPNDGAEFLESLYRKLAKSETVETTTPTKWLEEHGRPASLNHLHSGSWIAGNYQIWIGHEDDNRAWDLLNTTRAALHDWLSAGSREAARVADAMEALYIAEGSDWFWWYGDDFETPYDVDFDRLFRENLIAVYRIIGETAPPELHDPIVTEIAPMAALSKPTGLIRPSVDGRSDYFYEWAGAGVYRNTGGRGSMFENTRAIKAIYLGYDLEHLYLRIEPDRDLGDLTDTTFWATVSTQQATFSVTLNDSDSFVASDDPAVHEPLDEVAFDACVEAAIPFEDLMLKAGDDFHISVALVVNDVEQERHPGQGGFAMTVPDATFEGRNWIV